MSWAEGTRPADSFCQSCFLFCLEINMCCRVPKGFLACAINPGPATCGPKMPWTMIQSRHDWQNVSRAWDGDCLAGVVPV